MRTVCLVLLLVWRRWCVLGWVWRVPGVGWVCTQRWGGGGGQDVALRVNIFQPTPSDPIIKLIHSLLTPASLYTLFSADTTLLILSGSLTSIRVEGYSSDNYNLSNYLLFYCLHIFNTGDNFLIITPVSVLMWRWYLGQSPLYSLYSGVQLVYSGVVRFTRKRTNQPPSVSQSSWTGQAGHTIQTTASNQRSQLRKPPGKVNTSDRLWQRLLEWSYSNIISLYTKSWENPSKVADYKLLISGIRWSRSWKIQPNSQVRGLVSN